ncbi:hypothetical protein ACH5RR_021129 [Cinchona calisaya]|uniref:RNase H type-1 domain-containing protein n=1 Tax=Cinchona calisaya TaxID=153742 RepID=A0ABD2ZGE6_9GENT
MASGEWERGFSKARRDGKVEDKDNNIKLTYIWKPPDTGLLKINFDGEVFKEKMMVGVGVVVRDCTGRFVCGGSKKFRNYQSPKIAKILATRESVRVAENLANFHLIFEGDAMDIVISLLLDEQDGSDCENLIEEVKMMLRRIGSPKVTWVGREGNMIAHKLARYAKSISDVIFCSNQAPSFLEEQLKSSYEKWQGLP